MKVLADLEVTRFSPTSGHMGPRRCQSKVSIPLRPENSTGAGCDGMTVHCWFRWGNRMGATESWQDQEPATFQLARAVHRLATEVLREPTNVEALREIEMFFRP